MSTVGVSQKIEEDEERALARHTGSLQRELDIPAGFIARTAAEGVSEEALWKDMRYLERQWRSDSERTQAAQKPTDVIHADLPLAIRALRDLITP